MAQRVQIYRSGVAGHAPGTLLPGELAVNTTDKKFWAGDASTGAAVDLLAPVLAAANAAALLARQVNLRVSVKDFGALGNGTTDDTTAVRAAFTYAQTNARALWFPAGRYKLSGNLTWTAGTCVLQGEGMNLSVLFWTAAAATRGISVTLDQDKHPLIVEGLTLENQGATGTAIYCSAAPQVIAGPPGGVSVDRTEPRFLLRDVRITGTPSDPGHCGWDFGFDSQATLIGAIDNCHFKGCLGAAYPNNAGGNTYASTSAVRVGDLSITGQPCQFVIINSSMYYFNAAVQALEVQGLHVQSTDIVGVDTGIVFQAATAQPHCVVMGSHINANKNGVYLNGVGHANVVGNCFLRCSDGRAGQGLGYGISINNAVSSNGILAHNTFANTHATEPMAGIYFTAGRDFLVDGNIFEQFSATTGMSGIGINAGCTGIRVTDTNLFISDPGAAAFTYTIQDLGTRTYLNNLFTLVGRANNQALTAGVDAVVSWDTIHDKKGNNGLFTLANPGQMIVQIPGLYRIDANILFSFALLTATKKVYIRVNAGAKPGTPFVTQSGGGEGGFLAVSVSSAPLRLAAGDVIDVVVASSETAFVLGNVLTTLSVTRIGDG
jgi:hypothetical protein